MAIYSKIDEVPSGEASRVITPGCLVLEGGAWRGVYTQGAIDELMLHDINFQTTIGVSAGALSGTGYVSGQIGWSSRINLTYRDDSKYMGWHAFLEDKGITGFSYLFGEIFDQHPLNWERFNDPERRFVAVATNLISGEPEYFEKGKCEDILTAVQASATVPLVSMPVMIEGIPYLDGGCATHMGYDWALQEGFDKIMVIKTRDHSYRRENKLIPSVVKKMYQKYPNLIDDFEKDTFRYNTLLNRLDKDAEEGKIFLLEPSEPITIKRFEKDIEKIGAVYEMGRKDMQDRMEELREYLSK